MKWKPIIFATLGIIIAVPLLLPEIDTYWPHTQNDVITGVFKDGEIYSVIQNPQSATAQRLHSIYSGSETLDGYTNDAPVSLLPQQIEAIQKLLDKPSSYVWGMRTTCIPDYGVLLNFSLHSNTVRVALCFRCNIVGVFDGNDRVDYWNFVGAVRPQFVAIAKEIFPNDKEIQGLK